MMYDARQREYKGRDLEKDDRKKTLDKYVSMDYHRRDITPHFTRSFISQENKQLKTASRLSQLTPSYSPSYEQLPSFLPPPPPPLLAELASSHISPAELFSAPPPPPPPPPFEGSVTEKGGFLKSPTKPLPPQPQHSRSSSLAPSPNSPAAQPLGGVLLPIVPPRSTSPVNTAGSAAPPPRPPRPPRPLVPQAAIPRRSTSSAAHSLDTLLPSMPPSSSIKYSATIPPIPLPTVKTSQSGVSTMDDIDELLSSLSSTIAPSRPMDKVTIHVSCYWNLISYFR